MPKIQTDIPGSCCCCGQPTHVAPPSEDLVPELPLLALLFFTMAREWKLLQALRIEKALDRHIII